jgi:hypothetical protein
MHLLNCCVRAARAPAAARCTGYARARTRRGRRTPGMNPLEMHSGHFRIMRIPNHSFMKKIEPAQRDDPRERATAGQLSINYSSM